MIAEWADENMWVLALFCFFSEARKDTSCQMSQLHSVGNLAGVRNVVCVFRTNENNETVEMKSKLFVLFELKMNFALVIHVAVGPNGKKDQGDGRFIFYMSTEFKVNRRNCF